MKWAFFDSTGLAKPRKHKRAAAAHRERTGWRRAAAKTIDAGSPRGIQRRRKHRGRLVTEVTSLRIISHEPRRMVAAPLKVVSGRTKTAAVRRVDCCRRGRGKESGGGGAVGEVS